MKRYFGLFASCIALSAGSAFAAVAPYPVGTNIATLGTPQDSDGGGTAFLTDQNGPTQDDVAANGAGRQWSAVTFGQLRTFNELIIEQCANFVVAGYDVQVAKAGLTSPNPDNDNDWETIPGGSFTGQASNSTPTRQFALGSTFNRAGVRLRTTDSSNIAGGAQRPRELWVFDNYANLATSATITAPGWTGTALMKNERSTDQEFTGTLNNPANQDITFTWGSPQEIGKVMIHGGSGVSSEHLIDFTIQYFNGTSFVDFVAPVTGNTLKTVEFSVFHPIYTTQLRLHITKADNSVNDNFARVGEVFIFQALPEPTSVAMLAMGGAMVLARRRR